MLTLATRLRSMDDAALRHALTVREISPTGIRDFFDLAEALLAPDSVQRALSHLDRPTLATLAVAAEHVALSQAPTIDELTDRLIELGAAAVSADATAARVALLDSLLLLVIDDGRVRPYDTVAAQLARWPELGLPGTAELASAPIPGASTDISDAEAALTDRRAAERAFSVVSSIAELINELATEPARELSRGGIGLPDTKRLAAAMSVEPDAVPALFAIAVRASLISKDAGHWMETETGESWLLDGTTARWGALAQSWYSALPPDVREILSQRPGLAWGDGLASFVAWLHPAGGAWMDERVTEFARDAELIGITANQSVSSAGAAILAGDLAAATATMNESLPAEVGQVYLQHDLSIVSPGPLAPSIDARLRALADVESRELASSYRISHASVTRALAAGESASSLLEFLKGISLTGIPQPLEYLIVEAADRFGRVRVRPAGEPTASVQTIVRSDDPAILGTISVDQTLSHLGLVRAADDRLTSRFAPDVVFWALNDAKYPVAAENANGEIVHLRRHKLARVIETPTPDPAAGLVEALRASDAGESAAPSAWLARQLDAAIKSKQAVTVSISMPSGDVVDYLLEPASVGGGRFRARDRRADIERTLPISSIVRITPAP